MARKLSKTQQKVLDALVAVDGDEHNRWIAARVLADRTGQPVEGIGRTVSSLIIRGLAARMDNGKTVYYRSFDRWGS